MLYGAESFEFSFDDCGLGLLLLVQSDRLLDLLLSHLVVGGVLHEVRDAQQNQVDHLDVHGGVYERVQRVLRVVIALFPFDISRFSVLLHQLVRSLKLKLERQPISVL